MRKKFYLIIKIIETLIIKINKLRNVSYRKTTESEFQKNYNPFNTAFLFYLTSFVFEINYPFLILLNGVECFKFTQE